MKLWKTFFIVPAFISLALCSCNSRETEKENTTETIHTKLNMVTSCVEYSTLGAGNEDGYYYIDYSNSDGSTGYIRYIDYNTASDIPLTTQIASENDDDTSESYLESTIGGGTLGVLPSKLLYLRCGSPVFYEKYGENALPAIYIMNLDGSDRKLLLQGKSNEEYSTTVASDDSNIYFPYKQTTPIGETDVEAKEYIGRLNINTGHLETLISIPYGSRILGVYENQVILDCIRALPSQNYTVQEELLRFNVDTLSLESIDLWDTSDTIMYCYVCDSSLLKIDLTNRQFLITPLGSDSSTQVIDGKDIFLEKESSVWFPSYYDGYFFCQGSVGSQIWAINLRDGEKTSIDMTYYNSDKDSAQPFEICSENKTSFLLKGNAQITDMGFTTYQYVLINKSDYLSNNQSYRCISPIN